MPCLLVDDPVREIHRVPRTSNQDSVKRDVTFIVVHEVMVRRGTPAPTRRVRLERLQSEIAHR
jgi:hypothetical protein